MLTQEAFIKEWQSRSQAELESFQQRYRFQTRRSGIALLFGLAGFSLGLFTFFPTNILLFLAILYGLYLLFFGRKKRKHRVQPESDLQRLILKGIVATCGEPFTLQTHRYMPQFVFLESELFPFPSDTYDAAELMEIRGPGKITFSLVHAEKQVDAFDRGKEMDAAFRGWLFRIFPSRQATPLSETLPASYRVRITPDQIWMAVPQKEKLYRRKGLILEPDWPACYALYEAVQHALSMTRSTESGS